MTTEQRSFEKEAAINAVVCERDSLEDLTVVEDGAEGHEDTKEKQDVAGHNLEYVNESIQNNCKTTANCDDTGQDRKSTNSSIGSQESIGNSAGETPEKDRVEEQILNSHLTEKRVSSNLFNHKISRRRTIHGLSAIPKASSTRDLHRQTSEFGKIVPPRPRGSSLNISHCKSEDSPCVRETVSSRLRFAKGHVSHDQQECDGKTYVTPTQRKDMEMKQLKQEVKQLKKDVAERVEEIDLLKKNLDKEAAELIESKELKIKEIRTELNGMAVSQDELKTSYDDALRKISSLEKTVNELKAVISETEQKNAQIYYEMYRKGQESAKFERNFEIERMAAISGKSTSVTTRELLEKLMDTEMELAKWQSFRRQESYESADRPETEADAILRFLKDSFYHYITDQKQSDNHLRAMIRIFNYTEPQKKKIASAIAERINKKNSL